MDSYDPATVFSSIDQHGRYAYGNQPIVAQWNLARLAEALLPLLGDDREAALPVAQAAIDAYPGRFEAAFAAGFRRKLGLSEAQVEDPVLIKDLLELMTANKADFTLTFRRLSDAAGNPADDAEVRALFAEPAAFDELGGAVAGAAGAGRRRSGCPFSGDEGSQSRVHPAQSSCRGGTERGGGG